MAEYLKMKKYVALKFQQCTQNVNFSFRVEIAVNFAALCCRTLPECHNSCREIQRFKALSGAVVESVLKNDDWRCSMSVRGVWSKKAANASEHCPVSGRAKLRELGDLAPTFTGHLPAWSICHAPRRLRASSTSHRSLAAQMTARLGAGRPPCRYASAPGLTATRWHAGPGY